MVRGSKKKDLIKENVLHKADCYDSVYKTRHMNMWVYNIWLHLYLSVTCDTASALPFFFQTLQCLALNQHSISKLLYTSELPAMNFTVSGLQEKQSHKGCLQCSNYRYRTQRNKAMIYNPIMQHKAHDS